MKYGNIKYCDVANGDGIRTTLFVSGCTHHCFNCFNQMAWDFEYGKEFTKEVEDEIITTLRHGLTILGGEPMEIENAKCLVAFLERVRVLRPDLSIWIYTGFTGEEWMARKKEEKGIVMRIFHVIDILVDGRFVENLKDITLQFRGSSNQRINDVQKT